MRGLHAQNRPAEEAVAGQRVALNVTGSRLSKDAVTRGDWVLHPDVHAPTARFDMRAHIAGGRGDARCVPDAPVHLHLGAAHVTARVAALDAERIEPGSTVLARLTLDRPIGALARDRLVLRDATATRTIGGGVVIDPFPPRRGRRTPERLAQLAALDQPDPADALRALLALPPGWTDRVGYLRARNLSARGAAVGQAAAPAVAVADLLMAPATLDALRAGVMERLAAHHAAAPDQPGLQLERLRTGHAGAAIGGGVPCHHRSLFRRGAVEQDGPWLRLPTHRATLSAQDERVVAAGARADRRGTLPSAADARSGALRLSVPEAAMRAR